jgi:hypothetical protein
MVGSNRRQGMEIIVWEELFPPFRDESPVNSLGSGVRPLVTAHEESPVQVDFFKNGII